MRADAAGSRTVPDTYFFVQGEKVQVSRFSALHFCTSSENVAEDRWHYVLTIIRSVFSFHFYSFRDKPNRNMTLPPRCWAYCLFPFIWYE